MEHDGAAIEVSSDSDEAVDRAPPTAGGDFVLRISIPLLDQLR